MVAWILKDRTITRAEKQVIRSLKLVSGYENDKIIVIEVKLD